MTMMTMNTNDTNDTNDTNEITCHLCGQVISRDEAVEFGEYLICEDCEPHAYTCDCCGEIYDDRVDVAYDTEDWLTVCEDCIYRHYERCDDCGTYVRQGHLNYIDGEDRYVCECCFDNYGECSGCGQLFHLDHLYWFDSDECDYCQDCAENNRADVHDYTYKPDPEFKPEFDVNKLFMGVELEVDKGRDARSASVDINEHDREENVYLKHDGSLERGFEIVSHPCTLEYHKGLWDEIIDICKKYGFKSHDAKTCGLHVHLSRHYFGATETEQNYNIGKLILLMNKHWENMVKFSRRNAYQLNSWAKRVELCVSKFETIKGMELKVKDKRGNRYVAVNLNNRHTIELRLFNGTLRRETLLATLELCKNLADAAKSWSIAGVNDSTFGDIVRMNATEYLVDYCATRNIDLTDSGIDVIEKARFRHKGYGSSVGVSDLVHLSLDSTFAKWNSFEYNMHGGWFVVTGVRDWDKSVRVAPAYSLHESVQLGWWVNWDDIDIFSEEKNTTRRLKLVERILHLISRNQ